MFTSERALPSRSPTDPVALGTAIGTYLQILETQFPYLDSGFNLPNPVPADLLNSFGDFVTKYGLEAMVPTVFAFAEGLGNILENPCNLRTEELRSERRQRDRDQLVCARSHRNAVALRRRRGVLGERRDRQCADPGGNAGAITSKFSPKRPTAPCASKPASWSLRFRRRFPTWQCWRRTPSSSPCSAASTQTTTQRLCTVRWHSSGRRRHQRGREHALQLPPLPGMYGLQATEVPNYFVGLFGSATWLPDDLVKAAMVSSLQNVASSGIYPEMKFESIDVFSSHAPFNMMVSANDIAAGFYSKVNALQGHNHTFYTSAAFQTNDSSLIWQFTQGLLPQIVA